MLAFSRQNHTFVNHKRRSRPRQPVMFYRARDLPGDLTRSPVKTDQAIKPIKVHLAIVNTQRRRKHLPGI